LRSHHKIPVHRPATDGVEPWLNLTKAAALIDVSPKTLRIAAENGEIDATHPLPDGPWIFSRAVLTGSAGKNLTERAAHGAEHPAGRHHDQQNLFASIT
jgi:hypothetical protein